MSAAERPPPVVGTFLSRASLSRCVPIALLVGTVLSTVNQASVIAGGDTTWATWARIGVNFLMPFLVSSTGFLSGERAQWRARLAAVRSIEVAGEPGPGGHEPNPAGY